MCWRLQVSTTWMQGTKSIRSQLNLLPSGQDHRQTDRQLITGIRFRWKRNAAAYFKHSQLCVRPFTSLPLAAARLRLSAPVDCPRYRFDKLYLATAIFLQFVHQDSARTWTCSVDKWRECGNCTLILHRTPPKYQRLLAFAKSKYSWRILSNTDTAELTRRYLTSKSRRQSPRSQSS